ncbi:uncharacterized protein LOC135236262 isoform X2 [Anguilla rostrata]|uniref:uncharacterized protein LOC135236262 isoform X2 n=1 Tax=Anguilla rostrata TaxID=7938 RepID=UPI0030D2074B
MRVRCIDPNWAIKSVPPTVESSLSFTSSLRQPAANQLGLTGVNTTEVRRQQQHRTTPVKEDEETEPNPRMRCADSAEGDTAIVSELRATSRAGELQREGAGFAPGPVNKKKRSCPGSSPPSLLLSKGKDSRSSESTSGVTFSSSARREKGKRVPGRQFPLPKNVKEEKTDSTSTARFIPLEGAKDKQFKPFEEDLSNVNSDAQCSTRFECEPTAINKKKRIFSGSAVPLLPLSKRKDHRSPDRSPESILWSPANSGDGTQAKDFSQLANAADKTTSPSKKASNTQGVRRSLGGGASEFTSRTYRSEREELRSLKHSRESLSQVALDPRLTGLSGPPCQHCPPRQPGPADLQNHPRQHPALFISPRRRDRVTPDGGHHVSYTAQPPHRARMPANTLGDAPQPFQTQQSAFGMADFNRLMPAGTPKVFNSQRTPLTRFYHPGALAPSTGHTNTPVPAGSVHQGMNARSGFGITQSCIASAQNCALLNQPGSQFESRASHSGHMNVNSLLTRLISSGLIKPTITAQTQTAKTERVSEKQEEDNVQRVPDLTGFVKERMKRRYGGVVSELYAGRQCSSCGERFRSTHTRKYRDHLDWHYQQNSAKKNSQARAAHRAWYCRAQTYHPSCYEDYQNTF